MGRPKRITLGGYVYHVLSRANGRLRISKKKEDFAAFETILAEGIERVDMRTLRLLHYDIEANPLRAEIVARPGDDLWSSFAAREGLEKPFALSDGPLPIPKNWTQLVGRKLAVADQDGIRNSIRRGAPLGNPDWVKRAATELNLPSTIKPRGRPRKSTGHL